MLPQSKEGRLAIQCCIYRVRVCSCVRCRPQSFIKGSTLKGQLNYSLLTGGGGGSGGDGWHGNVATRNASLHPTPPYPTLPYPTLLSPSLRDESPSLFPKLINKISHSAKTLALVGVAANDGILCACVFLGVNQLSLVTAARCQCW